VDLRSQILRAYVHLRKETYHMEGNGERRVKCIQPHIYTAILPGRINPLMSNDSVKETLLLKTPHILTLHHVKYKPYFPTTSLLSDPYRANATTPAIAPTITPPTLLAAAAPVNVYGIEGLTAPVGAAPPVEYTATKGLT
jgi:hypothetical protein